MVGTDLVGVGGQAGACEETAEGPFGEAPDADLLLLLATFLGLDAGKLVSDLVGVVGAGRPLFASPGQLHGPSDGIGRLAFEYRGNRCDRDHLGNS